MNYRAKLKAGFIKERKYSVLMLLILFSAISFAVPESNGVQSLSAEQTKNIEQGMQNSFSGIGAGIEIHPKGIYISNVIAGGPADKSGLKGGEIITDIDGKSAIGLSLEQAVSLLKGPTGTNVNLKLFLSDGTSKELSIVRGSVTASGVFSRIIEPNIGLLTISSFSKESAAKVEDALLNFQQQKIKGLVLDIRNNKGGFLDEVKKIAGMFAEPNQVIWQVQNIGNDKRISVKSDVKKISQWPMVVVVNSGTMSGGELLASVLKSKKYGKLLGQKTPGEIAVYKFEKQNDGSSRKIRTGYFFAADGQALENKGVIPDVELDPNLPPEEIIKQAVNELVKEIENRKNKI